MRNLKLFFVFLLLFISCFSYAQKIAQWRGVNRDGIYEEQQLLKNWPENGPELRWVNEDIGDGFGSVAVTDDMIFVNGKLDSSSYTFALDINGNLLWKAPNGIEFTGRDYSANFPGPRSTPTVLDDFVYVSSGNGRIACLERLTGKEKWSRDMILEFNGVMDQHGYCESLVVDDKNVYCLPGGVNTNLAALDRFTGKTVWTSKAYSDSATYCSPMIINLPTRNILVTFSGHYLLGLDCQTGELLWSQRQAYHFYHQHCNTPVYSDGYIYYISGEGNGAVKLELSATGDSIKEVWRNNDIKNVFQGFVKIGNHIFSPDNSQKLKCIDTNTGQVIDSLRLNKGGLIYADSMLYCYSDNGNVNLIKLNETKMEITGKFKCEKGTKEHFAHPVIKNGVLYLRHGRALMAYNIKQ
jgi:outer membrane protein assembly factor BamB